MSRKVKIKEAVEIVGLSEYELRTGAKSGKYPHIRVGGQNGRIIFDIDLLENHIKEMMMNNVKADDELEEYGTIRKIK